MLKMENRRVAKIEKLKKLKIRAEHGEEAAPKGVTKTIESMRVKDETIITDADDEEIKGEHSIDEFASYFKSETTPRVLLTTNRRPRGVSTLFCFNNNFDKCRKCLASLKKSRQLFQVLSITKEKTI